MIRGPHGGGGVCWRRGELAALAGCHPETVRFYEQRGLLPPVARTPAGHRRYGAEHLRRLRFILAGRRLGFSLDEIRTLLELAERGGECAAVRRVAEHHLAEVDARLEALARVRARLAALVESCRHGGEPDCALLADLFAGVDQRLGGSDFR